MERETTELYPCPYSEAVRCCLQDPCKGCETWAKYLVGDETPRTLKQPERTAEEIRKLLKDFNGFMCSNQYDGVIPLIDQCIDDFLKSRIKK